MAGIDGREGLLVDIDTGMIRKDHVLVQHAPGAVFFLGFGARAERLRRFAFGEASGPDPFTARCRRIAAAVENGSLAKARHAGVSRAVLDIEDRILRRFLIAESLAKAGYDPDEPRDDHGRWASEGGAADDAAPPRIAQEDEDVAPEETADPLAPMRQALWNDAITRLRQIDPDNPNLASVANPGSAPSQAALDRLDATLEAAAIKRIADKVMPDGVPIGKSGTGPDIQELPGGLTAAQELFDYLRVGGTVYLSDSNITIVKLPGSAGYVTLRPVSSGKNPAIDINVPGARLKFHFP